MSEGALAWKLRDAIHNFVPTCYLTFELSGSVGKESVCNSGDPGSSPGSGRRKWQPTAVVLPGKCCGRVAWWATVHEVARVIHDLVTKP